MFYARDGFPWPSDLDLSAPSTTFIKKLQENGKKHKYSPTAENSAYNFMNSGDITKTGIAICLVLEKCCYLSQGGSKGQWAFCPRWASCPMLLYTPVEATQFSKY